eukprot:399258-Rhodomonas_salina.1
MVWSGLYVRTGHGVAPQYGPKPSTRNRHLELAEGVVGGQELFHQTLLARRDLSTVHETRPQYRARYAIS